MIQAGTAGIHRHDIQSDLSSNSSFGFPVIGVDETWQMSLFIRQAARDIAPASPLL